jgi:hypothetical protein
VGACSLGEERVLDACSMHARCMLDACSMHARCMLDACSMHARCIMTRGCCHRCSIVAPSLPLAQHAVRRERERGDSERRVPSPMPRVGPWVGPGAAASSALCAHGPTARPSPALRWQPNHPASCVSYASRAHRRPCAKCARVSCTVCVTEGPPASCLLPACLVLFSGMPMLSYFETHTYMHSSRASVLPVAPCCCFSPTT